MWYVGIDLHKKFFMAAAYNEQGVLVMEPVRVENDEKQILLFLNFIPKGSNLTCESTFNWKFFFRNIKDRGYSFTLVNPRKLKVISESFKKSDRNDCTTLALFSSKGLLTGSYIPEINIEDLRSLVRNRIYFVNKRSSFKTRIKILLSGYGIQKVSFIKDKFMNLVKDMQLINKGDKYNLLSMYRVIEFFTPVIIKYDREIKKHVNKNQDIKKAVKLLMTIPGIGFFRGALIKAEIGEEERFHTSSSFCCYSGIVPSTSGSADKIHHGPLIKQSSKYLRTAFVETANAVKNSRYRLSGDFIKYKTKLPFHAATIKLARKIAKIAIRVLKSEKAYYEELENKEKVFLKTHSKRMKYSKELKMGSRPTRSSLTCAKA